MELLLTKGAEVNCRNKDGETPLRLAIGDRQKVKLLLANGASVTTRDKGGDTPLHVAARIIGRKDVVELLLAKNADIHAKNKHGDTPLHEAAHSGRKDVVALTLDAQPYPTHTLPGTDVTFRGRFVHVARQGQDVRWMYLLEGASLSVGEEVLTAAGGDFSHRGAVTDILRSAKGDDENAFLTNIELPLAGLDGKTLLLELPDGISVVVILGHDLLENVTRFLIVAHLFRCFGHGVVDREVLAGNRLPIERLAQFFNGHAG